MVPCPMTLDKVMRVSPDATGRFRLRRPEPAAVVVITICLAFPAA